MFKVKDLPLSIRIPATVAIVSATAAVVSVSAALIVTATDAAFAPELDPTPRYDTTTDTYSVLHGNTRIMLPPCEQEDSANCFWDASTSGNNWGNSFYDLDGTAHYIDPAAEDFDPEADL